METLQLLNRLLKMFEENISQADFFSAYSDKPGNRCIKKTVVTGEIDSEAVNAQSEETRFRFKIFLPENQSTEAAEEIFVQMCRLAGENFTGFSAISRGAAERDRVTGLLAVTCSLNFVKAAIGATAPARRVDLGGREYTVSGVKTTFSENGKELVAVGETEPFAVLNAETEYTVELEGINVAGLDKLAAFTAKIGEASPVVYHSCRWKTLSDVLDRAVFVSHERE